MRTLVLLGLGCALIGAPATAHATRFTRSDSTALDTTATVRFNLPAQGLTRALTEYGRQAGVRVQVDASAARALSSRAVTGAYTAPEALRQLLAGSGMSGRFADNETVLVTRTGMGTTTL